MGKSTLAVGTLLLSGCCFAQEDSSALALRKEAAIRYEAALEHYNRGELHAAEASARGAVDLLKSTALGGFKEEGLLGRILLDLKRFKDAQDAKGMHYSLSTRLGVADELDCWEGAILFARTQNRGWAAVAAYTATATHTRQLKKRLSVSIPKDLDTLAGIEIYSRLSRANVADRPAVLALLDIECALELSPGNDVALLLRAFLVKELEAINKVKGTMRSSG